VLWNVHAELAGLGMPMLADPKLPMLAGLRVPTPTSPGVAGPEMAGSYTPIMISFQPIANSI